MHYFAIAIGGAVGAVLRYWMSSTVYEITGREFPWGTLAVNALGSLLIGVLAVLLIDRMDVSDAVRVGLVVGVLGAFTTFSTFSIETLTLLEQGAVARAAMNTVVSVIVCVAAAWLGATLARTF